MTLNYYNANIESLRTCLAETERTIAELNKIEILEYRREKINRALKLRNDISKRIEQLEEEKKSMMLNSMKNALLDCISAADDEELGSYKDMLSKFNALHPEI